MVELFHEELEIEAVKTKAESIVTEHGTVAKVPKADELFDGLLSKAYPYEDTLKFVPEQATGEDFRKFAARAPSPTAAIKATAMFLKDMGLLNAVQLASAIEDAQLRYIKFKVAWGESEDKSLKSTAQLMKQF